MHCRVFGVTAKTPSCAVSLCSVHQGQLAHSSGPCQFLVLCQARRLFHKSDRSLSHTLWSDSNLIPFLGFLWSSAPRSPLRCRLLSELLSLQPPCGTEGKVSSSTEHVLGQPSPPGLNKMTQSIWYSLGKSHRDMSILGCPSQGPDAASASLPEVLDWDSEWESLEVKLQFASPSPPSLSFYESLVWAWWMSTGSPLSNPNWLLPKLESSPGL